MNTDLELRLAQLELANISLQKQLRRQQRFVRFIAFACAGMALIAINGGAAMLWADGTFDTVYANKIVVRDAKGRDRIVMDVPDNATYESQIALLSQEGKLTCSMTQNAERAIISARRFPGDKPSASLVADGDVAVVVASSGGGSAPIEMTAWKDRYLINLRDRKAGQGISTLVNKDGPSLTFTDSKGDAKIRLWVDVDGKPQVRIQDSPLGPISTTATPAFEINNEVLTRKRSN